MDARDPHSASLCLTFRALRLLAAWDKVVQGQVGVSLIKSMCSTEAPPCNAIKHVYSPPLHTFFFSPRLFIPLTKCPLAGQSITLPAPWQLQDYSSGIESEVRYPHGSSKSSRQYSLPSLFLAGAHACWSVVGAGLGIEEGRDRMAGVLRRTATWSLSCWCSPGASHSPTR